jgi:predicted nucleotide-binding protein
MYSLLVTSNGGAWDKPDYIFDVSRFLKFTDDGLKARLMPLTKQAITELLLLPTIFAYETDVGAPARVGWLKTIKTKGSKIRITFALDPSIAPITPDRLEAMSWDLDIEGGTNHTHWAVKERDLLEVLRGNGLLTVAAPEFRFSRQTLLKASAILRTLGHTSFDHFVLALGVESLKAGRDRGGLLGRANALGAYAIENAQVPTAEGEQLGLALVRRAVQADPNPEEERTGLPDKERTAFRESLRKDGYAIENGEIVALPDNAATEQPPYAMPPEKQAKSVALPTRTPSASDTTSEGTPTMAGASPTKVFIVHGRGSGPKYEVAHLLRQLELEPIILHDRPNKGRTLISKFQDESADIGFAVVMMTPDDVGGLAGKKLKPRARQNVIFELGFFIGKLGPNRVCALVSDEIEKPSDFEAVVYVEYGANTGWKTELARELHAAGIDIDMNKLVK